MSNYAYYMSSCIENMYKCQFLPKSRETKDVGFFNGFHLGENGPHASSNGHVQDMPRDNE